MIVIVDKCGYVVPASIVVALKRRFDTVRVRELGMTMDNARGFVRPRLRGKVRYQHFRAGVEVECGVALPPDVPPRARREFVAVRGPNDLAALRRRVGAPDDGPRGAAADEDQAALF